MNTTKRLRGTREGLTNLKRLARFRSRDEKGATVGGTFCPARHGSARLAELIRTCRLGRAARVTIKEDHFLYLIQSAIRRRSHHRLMIMVITRLTQSSDSVAGPKNAKRQA